MRGTKTQASRSCWLKPVLVHVVLELFDKPGGFTAADRQLVLQSRRHRRSAGSDEDAVERRVFREAVGSVADPNVDVDDAQRVEDTPRRLS